MKPRYEAYDNHGIGWEVRDTWATPPRTFAANMEAATAEAVVAELNQQDRMMHEMSALFRQMVPPLDWGPMVDKRVAEVMGTAPTTHSADARNGDEALIDAAIQRERQQGRPNE